MVESGVTDIHVRLQDNQNTYLLTDQQYLSFLYNVIRTNAQTYNALLSRNDIHTYCSIGRTIDTTHYTARRAELYESIR